MIDSRQIRKLLFGPTRQRAGALASLTAAVLLLAAGAQPALAAHYALIVNGDDSFTHNENVALALAALPQLGYAAQDTFLLAPDAAGRDAAPAWRQRATETGLRQALAQLQRRLHPGDELLVYLTGHAYRLFGHTSLGLASGTLSATELLHRLGELPFDRLVLIADPCYSGGFVKAAMALGRNVVAISSADDRHEVRCEPFVRPFWIAAGEKPGVTVEEAFQEVADSLRLGGGAAADDTPQYAASGSCAGHSNGFSTAGGDH